jgi:hypothetical protein
MEIHSSTKGWTIVRSLADGKDYCHCDIVETCLLINFNGTKEEAEALILNSFKECPTDLEIDGFTSTSSVTETVKVRGGIFLQVRYWYKAI